MEPPISPNRPGIEKYLRIMLEFDNRIQGMEAAYSGQLNLQPAYMHEYCYFQLRRLCELMALGCLFLHGDALKANARKVRSEWNAHHMMTMLKANHAHCFPQAIELKGSGTKEDPQTITPKTGDGILTEAEFKKLYADCGDALHRGTMLSIELERGVTQEEIDKMRLWQTKLVGLMNQHVLAHASGRACYVVTVRDRETDAPRCSFTALDPVTGGFTVEDFNVALRDPRTGVRLNPGTSTNK